MKIKTKVVNVHIRSNGDETLSIQACGHYGGIEFEFFNRDHAQCVEFTGYKGRRSGKAEADISERRYSPVAAIVLKCERIEQQP